MKRKEELVELIENLTKVARVPNHGFAYSFGYLAGVVDVLLRERPELCELIAQDAKSVAKYYEEISVAQSRLSTNS